MGEFKYFIIGATKRTGANGDWYVITLNISVKTGSDTRDYVSDVYTDAVIYGKAQDIPKFAEVDCIFVPNSRGKAVIVSLEAL